MFLIPVIEYNAAGGERERSRYAHLASLLGLPARTARDGVASLTDAARKLMRSLEVEPCIRKLGVNQDDFIAATGHMAESAMADRCTPSAPRRPTKDELIAIYKKAY